MADLPDSLADTHYHPGLFQFVQGTLAGLGASGECRRYLNDGEANKQNPVAVLGSFCQDFVQQAGIGGVSLSLVRSLRSGFLRFPAGSRCVTSPGSISHTGRSFDWNNPSMNCLYHRTFLYPVPYIHKVGITPEIRKFPRLRNGCGIMALLRQAGRKEGVLRL